MIFGKKENEENTVKKVIKKIGNEIVLFSIEGDTYQIKDNLKNLHYRWDGEKWYKITDKISEEYKKIKHFLHTKDISYPTFDADVIPRISINIDTEKGRRLSNSLKFLNVGDTPLFLSYAPRKKSWNILLRNWGFEEIDYGF